MTLPFDAVLCDLDGVLRIFDPDGLARESDFGLDADTVKSVAFAPELVNRAVTGEITDEEWQALIAEQLTPLCGPAAAAELTRAFVVAPHRVNTPVLELLTQAREHVPVVLVTNATTRLERDLARVGLLNAVDAIVNSSAVGVAKPDRRIYEIAAERAGVAVSRCLFIDDSAGNVRAARQLGMTGVVYGALADLETALGPLLGTAPRY
ncbi:HAD-IA family hydrolase [Planotetraspora sp. A-T 1434]|uniref:HAD-IA family hydrolase n=1 Tax=Planotetraspora sp. A-T 1434 TaxID=2979219 RepID=UPI0021BFE03C|nr:HAD-IA family hydrolase [Planotetraspora sp. A-T 1434]MCT9934880.1 HAD-IA family hydrolase [Planotetraspora sp. A-T 1434]